MLSPELRERTWRPDAPALIHERFPHVPSPEAPAHPIDGPPIVTENRGADDAYLRNVEALRSEAERLFAEQRFREAESFVHDLIAMCDAGGERRSRDRALGRSMLAELRFFQDDPVGAERLFREAIAIRRETLGERHPEYATSLASLAAVVFSQGNLDEAETLYREIIEIRTEVFGRRHFETTQAKKELLRLQRKRQEMPAPAPAATVAPTEQPPTPTTDPAASDANAPLVSSKEEDAPSAETRNVSDALRLIDDSLAARLREYTRSFSQAELGPAAGIVPAARSEHLDALVDAGSLIDGARAEIRQNDRERIRSAAQQVLERVLSLSHAQTPTFAPLHACQEQARVLLDTIRQAHWSLLPRVADELARGNHPLAALAAITNVDAGIDDSTWRKLHTWTGEAFGEPLATAILRGRIVVK